MERNGEERGDAVLAGELALGLLSGEERAAAEARARDDLQFAALVEDWHSKLGDFVAETAPATPSPQVWQGIEQALFPSKPAPASLWQSLAFWRWLTAGAGTLAVASLAALFMLITSPPVEPPRLIAALQASGAGPSFLAQLDAGTGRLAIRIVRAELEAPHVPELWLIPEDGVPRSLGVIAGDDFELVVPESLLSAARSGATLAISLEPEGGSPTGQPTGPVIAAGTLGEI